MKQPITAASRGAGRVGRILRLKVPWATGCVLPRLVVFDFDGVLTDNRVMVLENGMEAVQCCRADGLGFDLLRVAKVPVLILSTESNRVVAVRARKLRVPVLQGVDDKGETLRRYCHQQQIQLSQVAFVGNDINDLAAMRIVGLAVCPADAHPEVKKVAALRLKLRGGQGVVRELASCFGLRCTEKV